MSDTPEQPATLNAELTRQGLSVKAEFVPFSKSRDKDNKDPSLNWRVTLCRRSPVDGQDFNIITTDYGAGSGHCPAYKAAVKPHGKYDRQRAIAWECEHGKRARQFFGSSVITGKEPILPEATHVIYSLLDDSGVIDYATYEDWASEFGYDPDSRKGEAIYKACLEIALKLRNGLGEKNLAALREAAEGF